MALFDHDHPNLLEVPTPEELQLSFIAISNAFPAYAELTGMSATMDERFAANRRSTITLNIFASAPYTPIDTLISPIDTEDINIKNLWSRAAQELELKLGADSPDKNKYVQIIRAPLDILARAKMTSFPSSPERRREALERNLALAEANLLRAENKVGPWFRSKSFADANWSNAPQKRTCRLP